MKYIKFISLTIVLLIACGDGPQEPEGRVSTLTFIPDALSIILEEEGELIIQIKDFDDSIFGISMRIAYDSSIVSFKDSVGFEAGDFFGSDIVVFINEESALIHLTVTLQQGQQEVSGTGELGELKFIGKSPGSSTIEIISSELNFFDSGGNRISISDLKIEFASVTVVK